MSNTHAPTHHDSDDAPLRADLHQSAKQVVYVVQHQNENTEPEPFGVFTTREKAQSSINREKLDGHEECQFDIFGVYLDTPEEH